MGDEKLRGLWSTYLPDYGERHPERPWYVWDCPPAPLEGPEQQTRWLRTDGRFVEVEPLPRGVDASPEWYAATLPQLADFDRTDPLPCPEPAVGQVWALLASDHASVGGIGGVEEFRLCWRVDWTGPLRQLVGGLAKPGHGVNGIPEWGGLQRAQGLHLVGGPGAPWSPAEVPDGE